MTLCEGSCVDLSYVKTMIGGTEQEYANVDGGSGLDTSWCTGLLWKLGSFVTGSKKKI